MSTAVHDEEVARVYVRLVTRLSYLVAELEYLGKNDMGVISNIQALRFHDATDTLRELNHVLKQGALWPHEAGGTR